MGGPDELHRRKAEHREKIGGDRKIVRDSRRAAGGRSGFVGSSSRKQGIDAPSQRVYARAGKWPATLAGISATLSGVNVGPGNLALSIGSVFPFENCVGVSCTTTTMTGLTVQFPFEMFAGPTLPFTPPLGGMLTISDASGNTASMLVVPMPDQIHVIRSGDTLRYSSGGGASVVTHADGSLVSASSPARQQEVLTMYAAGLGVTIPAVASGLPSPSVPLAHT